MKAYIQGTVDYFCAVYAAMNACRAAARRQKRLTYDEGCTFYQHLIDFLLDNDLFRKMLHHGTDYETFERILNQAVAYMGEKHAVFLTWERPFAHTDAALPDLLNKVRAHLQRPETSCVLRIHSRAIGDHWTAAQSVGRTKINLADSYGFDALPVDKIRYAPHKPVVVREDGAPTGFQPPKDSGIYLIKKGVFLIQKAD